MKGMIKRLCFSSRRRTIVTALGTALVCVGVAVAAWVTFTISGNGGGKFGNAATGTITFAADTAGIVNTCQPGGNCDLGVDVTNSTTTPGHLTALSITSATSSASGCTLPAGTVTVNPSVVGTTLPAGGPSPIVIPNALHIDPAAPICAAGSTLSVAVSGTAGP